jgi:hypothetical protein
MPRRKRADAVACERANAMASNTIRDKTLPAPKPIFSTAAEGRTTSALRISSFIQRSRPANTIAQNSFAASGAVSLERVGDIAK